MNSDDFFFFGSVLLFSALGCASSIERLTGNTNAYLLNIVEKKKEIITIYYEKNTILSMNTVFEEPSESSQLIIIHAKSIAVFLKSGILLFLAIGNKAPKMLRSKNSLKG